MFKTIKEFTNTGFGSNVNNEGERLITKEGKFNVKKEGLSFLQRFNLFHALINMGRLSFLFCLLLSFIVINTFFALIYLYLGIEGLQGISTNNNFLEAFYFSSQTLTTVGYGSLNPVSNAINIVASFEAFIGLLSFALATGLLYGRLSKPRAKIMFSKNALLSPYRGEKGLMMRIANPKSSQLINVEAKIIYSQIETEDNENKRKFYTLDLEMNKINLLATSWTIVHPISNESPLYQLTEEALKKRNIELILMLDAYDETYSQNVHARTSYKYDEVVDNAKFISILGHNDEQQSIIKLDKLDDYDKV